MFEVEIAGLAAVRASDENIQRLEDALAQMTAGAAEVDANPAGLEQFVQADLLFHQILATASKNSLLPLLLAPITDLLLEFSRRASSLAPAPQNAIRFHKLLVEAVRDHDSARCRAVMRDHLTDAEQFIDQMTGQHTD
jgi:GntR family transcriptional repressor for pyruvate dehydrogenase complex